MRKVVAGINMTVDGFCDHTVMMADEEIHDHFTKLINDGGVILYGRTTYQLMQSYWPTVVKNPTGEKSTDDFAIAIENIPKIVFSHTLDNNDPTIIQWKNVTLAKVDLKQEVLKLKQQSGNDILVGSPSLIVALTQLNLIDEYKLCVHPVIVGSGLPLFRNVIDKSVLKLIDTKLFSGGAISLHYQHQTKN